MEIEGKIIAVMAAKGGISKNGNSWKTQEFVVEEVKDQYPQSVNLEIFGEDKINEFNPKVGDMVNVQFNVTSRQFGARYYNTCRAWKLTKQGSQGGGYQAPASAPSSASPTPSKAPEQSKQDDGDDLPF